MDSLALPAFGFQFLRVSVEHAGLCYHASVLRDQLVMQGIHPCSLGLLKADGTVVTEDIFSSAQLQNCCADAEDIDIKALMDVEDVPYLKWLYSLDPAQWKNQDHYKVLGLSKLRHSATMDQIRAAYRVKVLVHHPDKRRKRAASSTVITDVATALISAPNNDYYSCITKAYDLLWQVGARRAYDSVDDTFDESIPASTDSSETFFRTFNRAFERNSRWSKKQNVPFLGEPDTPFEIVDRFYQFWFNFESWREYSYLDEEDKERAENRDERRWIERENRGLREKRRKDEMKRIRKLVDNAFECDPRIKQHKDDIKRRKDEEKAAKQEDRRLKKEQEQKVKTEAMERERFEKEAEETAEREKAQVAKKEKEAKKKALQNERRVFQGICKAQNNFCNNEKDESVKIGRMANLDRLTKSLCTDDLSKLNSELKLSDGKESQQLESIDKFLKLIDDHIAHESGLLQKSTFSGSKSGNAQNVGSKNLAQWSHDEVQSLIKAMTLFPVGTKQRWEVIAAFLGEHYKSENNTPKTGKDVINKVKQLQEMGFDAGAAQEAGAVAANPLQAKQLSQEIHSVPSMRTEAPSQAIDSDYVPWSTEEQKLLEQALRSYSATCADRWQRISECIPGRTKKDCMKRFKELAELIKAKKNAQKIVSDSQPRQSTRTGS